MALNVFNFLKKREKQQARFADILGKDSSKTQDKTNSVVVPVLDDIFEETSTGVFAQIKKYPFLNLAEFIETQRTSFDKHSIFIIEILDDVVNASIVSRKGVFLDIGFLRSYSYDDLKEIYFKIIPDSTESSQEIKSSIENIISIVAYDVSYTLPKKIVIVENNYVELRQISIKTGRFIDDSAEDLMMRDLIIETGISEDNIIYSAIKKHFKKGDKEIVFLVSLAEKEHYNSVDTFVNEAGFNLKKIHSIESSLYASFNLKDRIAIMRIHVQDNHAYSLHKIKDENFEYFVYNIKEDYDDLELTALQAQEVILSGSGDYYEMLKSSFIESHVSVRWWNYEYDLKRCIVRLEEGYELNNSYANIISTAYYELFNMRLALVRLGVSTKLSLYEFVAVHLSIIPILLIIFTLFGITSWYYFEHMKVKNLENTNKKYSKYYKQEKSLNREVSRYQTNIAKVQQKIKNINKIIDEKVEIQDAAILYEIATKLPDDMILIEIQKDKQGVVIIKGKCYLEQSLFDYIKDLNFKKKKIYLVGMKDSQKTRLESNTEANIRHISESIEELNHQTSKANDDKPKIGINNNVQLLELLISDAKTTVKYADTLNNSFTLEIK